MTAENLDKKNSSLVIEGPLSSEELFDYFFEHSDLTYRTIRNLKLSDLNVVQSLFTGSLIQNCVFSNVIFRRSDLDGVRAENTTFIGCDFSNCDIRSSVFSQCRFVKCSFESALVDDCEFRKCEIMDCDFKHTLTSYNHFNNSSLHNCNLSPSSFLHNKLYSCTLSDMVLGDCTFMYVIFRDCTLKNIKINAESIGAILGLTKRQLDGAGILFLGNEQIFPSNVDVLEIIIEEYRNRKWLIGELLLAINFGLESILSAFETYLSYSFERFKKLGFAKGDEIKFLGDVIHELAYQERLPFLVALNILEWCSELELILSENNQDESLTETALRILANRTSLLTSDLLTKLEQVLPDEGLAGYDRELCVRSVFHEEPNVSFTELLNGVRLGSDLNIEQPTRLVRIQSGSYIEIVYTTLLTLVALQIFLFLTNGCIIQFTELKNRVKVLLQKQSPKNYKKLALSPSQQVPPLILGALQSLTKYASGLPWLKDLFMAGYTGSNINSLQEVKCEDQSK